MDSHEKGPRHISSHPATIQATLEPPINIIPQYISRRKRGGINEELFWHENVGIRKIRMEQ